MVLFVVGGHHVDTTLQCGQITPPPNGSTGSTTAASTRTAAMPHLSNWILPITLNAGDQPPAEFSDQTVSGLTGMVPKGWLQHFAVRSVDERPFGFSDQFRGRKPLSAGPPSAFQRFAVVGKVIYVVDNNEPPGRLGEHATSVD
jgi:hypothetical protein